MIIKLGPITIMDSKTRDAYRNVHRKAYYLHQQIWYTDEWTPKNVSLVKDLDALLSQALSHAPAEDIV